MSWVDLRQDANAPPPETKDGICSVCQKLNFEWDWDCPETPHDHESIYFQIGTVGRLLEKPSCPGCRIILSSLEIPILSQQSFIEHEITFGPEYISDFDDNLENNKVERESFGQEQIIDDGIPLWEAYFEVELDNPRDASSESRVGRIVRNGAWYPENQSANGTCANRSKNAELRGRTIPPTIDISIIKDWMKVCETQHDHCKTLSSLSPHRNGIRLIDVQEQMLVNSTQSERYVALSYVWGPATPAILTKDTLSRYFSKQGLQTARLPQTILDCIQLVRDLGERYLWVDSVCIVQDDDSDKLEQLRAMDSVYNSAALVVVAAAGNDAHAGLCGVKDVKRNEWQRRETVCGIPYITAQPPLRGVLKQTTWNSRGWTFQEAALARRILFFTDKQVYWSCKRGNWREDMAWQISDGVSLPFPPDSFWEIQKPLCRTAKYCQDVVSFTQREIRSQSDVIWAFMGILKLHSSRFPGGFIWGHPLERLDATLLWDGCPGNHQRTAQYPLSFNNSLQSVEYPSWSWLSTNTAIKFKDECGDSIISAVTWHEPLLFEDTTDSTTTDGISKLGKHINPIFSGSKGDATKYGLLRCTAETVQFSVILQDPKTKQQDQTLEEKENHLQSDNGTLRFPLLKDRIEATVYLPSGERVGNILVYRKFFDGNNQRLGQFILLSSNAVNETDENCIETMGGWDCGNILHVHGCKHIRSYNTMLIERRGDVAYRLGLLTMKRELWQKVKTRKEHFILG